MSFPARMTLTRTRVGLTLMFAQKRDSADHRLSVDIADSSQLQFGRTDQLTSPTPKTPTEKRAPPNISNFFEPQASLLYIFLLTFITLPNPVSSREGIDNLATDTRTQLDNSSTDTMSYNKPEKDCE
jgi:hypothetical protein